MRFRVVPGATLTRGVTTYAGGDEFDASGDDAQELLDSGLVERVDKPKSK